MTILSEMEFEKNYFSKLEYKQQMFRIAIVLTFRPKFKFDNCINAGQNQAQVAQDRSQACEDSTPTF